MKPNQLAAVLAFCILPAASACAQWSISTRAGIEQTELKEYDTRGRELVREHGAVPGLGLRAEYAWTDWRVGIEASTFRGDIAYDGRLQNGTPFATRTDTAQDRLGFDTAYRLSDSASLIAGIEWEHRKRSIRGNGSVGGLDERTTSWRLLAGARMRLAQLAGHDLDLTALAVAAQPERLQVGFDKHVYDDARLSTKSATGLRAGLTVLPASMPHLSATLEFDWMRVRRSNDAMLTANGMPAGTVSQPEHRRRTLSAWVNYRFD